MLALPLVPLLLEWCYVCIHYVIKQVCQPQPYKLHGCEVVILLPQIEDILTVINKHIK